MLVVVERGVQVVFLVDFVAHILDLVCKEEQAAEICFPVFTLLLLLME